MTDMIRKQIYLKSRQIRFLQRRANLLGISQSELIRRAIDHELHGYTSSFYPDPEAKESLKQFLLTYQPTNLPGPPYRFNREEIYEERLGRYRGDSD
jgi:hypothetical protein